MKNRVEITAEGMILKKQTKESLEKSGREAKRELSIVLRLKQSIIDYVGLYDDTTEDNTSGLCFLLGQLELSIAQRRQMLIDDNKQ